VTAVDTLASGRVVVSNTGASAWFNGDTWRLEQDLRIGTDAGRAVEQFGSIAGIAADSHGRIYVLDRMSKDVRVFNADGTFSHSFGREGQGPGEFSFPQAIAVNDGDSVLVVDDGTARYSVFAPDGSFLASYPRQIRGYLASTSGGFLADGRYIDWAPGFPDGREGSRTQFYPIIHGSMLEQADTMVPLEYTSPMLPSGRMQQWYFTGTIVAAVDARGGIWFARSREYEIYRRTPEGDTTHTFSLRATAAPISDRDRDMVRNEFANRPELGAEILAVLPETRPIVHGIVPDNAGHILLFVDVAGEQAGRVVDVFQENGQYLGRMVLPIAVPLSLRHQQPVAFATAAALYVVAGDSLDVPYVARLRIVKGQ
jgi:hypothetical protein